MGAFTVGSVVLVPFPFSDLSGSKKRPALLLADVGRGDWVCLQITSNAYGDCTAILLKDEECAEGFLARTSTIRPGKLFTAHESLFIRCVARIADSKMDEVRQTVLTLIKNGRFQEHIS
ncbi:MAG TPA: type II toxin-antitoxin system PemK/MazF family toxin [Synergistaceae bacterium]|nr:type II toxin-antitoxin system PemK/MazF family toxin [Synergistaceae bacterium]HQF90797.1 type II toxin-antitoxin system PemK/MazF family toxin [Synergistaceae bacterium]HQH78946.1 type II toxin-antitoxin system PemK/MazF family toxin [Synergistaceae bacterium]HQK25699.1 type II toxin-antitoxin system PemK/MazF family toxin [Synergistaceae bacterium]